MTRHLHELVRFTITEQFRRQNGGIQSYRYLLRWWVYILWLAFKEL